MGEPNDHRPRAPQHAVSLIASIAAPPQRGPAGEPTDAQWAAQIRRVADAVWAEAFIAGAAFQAEVRALAGSKPPPDTSWLTTTERRETDV